MSSTAAACPHCGYKEPTVAALEPSAAPLQETSTGCGTTIVLALCFFFILFLIIAGLGSLGNNRSSEPDGANHYRTPEEEHQILLEQRDKFAESCKNGHASDCTNEQNLTNLLNAGGINTSP